ncbi:MAG: Unknown protein [uncultured Sulfurovum sp.]|uniref:Uncharacterized protein n=1 Tax=uncultured Sulfurovum sp. TaxID=269237 RepID=A0A6S6TL07_9BACT|nr:MAG: Unknown protein [uncultured Sulfurovum sp.]
MSNTEELKKYLLEKEGAFLLDENNNGKTIMLSGAWGAGKTHFWQNKITKEDKDKFSSEEYEEGLFSKLKEKNKACVYVSLYGKDSLDSLKKEIYIKASSETQLLSKEVSTFGFDALSSIKDSDLKIGQALKAIGSLKDKRKNDKGIKRLKDGGLICLDDFERKSNKINLNDLFGFISQLAIDMNCKIVIILNSDVFTGKEAEVFRNVKEKTVNKFFDFEPTIEELFQSISKDKKYDDLKKEYKGNILKAILETEELNARIYIQVLDNCLEWLKVKESLNDKIIRVLTLGTFNFVLNHMILDYQEIEFNGDYGRLEYTIINFYSNRFSRYCDFNSKDKTTYLEKANAISQKEFIQKLKKYIYQTNGGMIRTGNKPKEYDLTDNEQEQHIDWIIQYEKKLKVLWKYGYQLYYVADVNKETYKEIAQFIKSGILI